MTNTDRKVAVTALAAAAALLVAGCGGETRTRGQEAGVPSPSDGPIAFDRPVEPDVPIRPDTALADWPRRGRRRSTAAMNRMACVLKDQIVSAACTRCLVAGCCEVASACELVTGRPLLGGGRMGCEGALFCAKRCPDAGGGACRIDVSEFLTAERCAQGPLGPQGVSTLVSVARCAAARCAHDCAQL